MKPKILIIIAITIVLFSCHTKREIPENKPQIIQKDFFFFGDDADRQKTKHLELDSFKTYKELVEKIEDLTCKDTLPYISWQEENIRKNVFIHNRCPLWCGIPPRIKRNRIIQIKNNSIYDEKLVLNYKNLIDIINKRIQEQGKSEEDEVYLVFFMFYENGFPPEKILPDIQMLIHTVEQYKPAIHFSLTFKKNNYFNIFPLDILPPPPPDMINLPE